MTFSILNREQAKAYARLLRADRAQRGAPISHSRSLELIAKAAGYRDWNTLSAGLNNSAEQCLQVGDWVGGHYLKQPFSGCVRSVCEIAEGLAWEVEVDFDEAVDVVTFSGFSNLRHRVKCFLTHSGVSIRKTSDGVPHMIISASRNDRPPAF